MEDGELAFADERSDCFMKDEEDDKNFELDSTFISCLDKNEAQYSNYQVNPEQSFENLEDFEFCADFANTTQQSAALVPSRFGERRARLQSEAVDHKNPLLMGHPSVFCSDEDSQPMKIHD